MVKSRLKKAIKKTYRPLHGWQRLPAKFVLDGWLRPDGAAGKPVHRLPHPSISTLLGLYAQLFERNLEVDPVMQGNEFEADVELLVKVTGRKKDRIDQTLSLLRRRGFMSSRGGAFFMLDPVSRAWPPRSFAMLPIRFLVEKLPELRQVSKQRGLPVGDVLALYVVLAVQRNHATEEVWFSRDRTSSIAGLDDDVGLKCLSVLMRTNVVVRSGLSSFKYQLMGFEAADRE